MYKDKKFVILPDNFAIETIRRGYYIKDEISGFKQWLPKKSVKVIFDQLGIYKWVIVDSAYLAHFRKTIKIAKEKGGDK